MKPIIVILSFVIISLFSCKKASLPAEHETKIISAPSPVMDGQYVIPSDWQLRPLGYDMTTNGINYMKPRGGC